MWTQAIILAQLDPPWLLPLGSQALRLSSKFIHSTSYGSVIERETFMPITVAPRTEPVQQRSTERITHLLDAAADLIDEGGIDGLTTNDVATRAHSSVGVVYRYFPNIQSLLRALAARNMEHFTERVFGASTEDGLAMDAAQWTGTMNLAISEYVDMMRNVPGFRALGFGDVIDRRFIQGVKSNNTVLAESFAELCARRLGVLPSAELSLDLEVIVEIVDALLQRAFRYEKRGDERILDRLRTIAQDIMTQHAVLSGR